MTFKLSAASTSHDANTFPILNIGSNSPLEHPNSNSGANASVKPQRFKNTAHRCFQKCQNYFLRCAGFFWSRSVGSVTHLSVTEVSVISDLEKFARLVNLDGSNSTALNAQSINRLENGTTCLHQAFSDIEAIDSEHVMLLLESGGDLLCQDEKGSGAWQQLHQTLMGLIDDHQAYRSGIQDIAKLQHLLAAIVDHCTRLGTAASDDASLHEVLQQAESCAGRLAQLADEETRFCTSLAEQLHAVLENNPQDIDALEKTLIEHHAALHTPSGEPNPRFSKTLSTLQINGNTFIRKLINSQNWRVMALLQCWADGTTSNLENHLPILPVFDSTSQSEAIFRPEKSVNEAISEALQLAWKTQDGITVDWMMSLFKSVLRLEDIQAVQASDGNSLLHGACRNVANPSGGSQLDHLLRFKADLLHQPPDAPVGYAPPYLLLQKALGELAPSMQYIQLSLLRLRLIDQLKQESLENLFQKTFRDASPAAVQANSSNPFQAKFRLDLEKRQSQIQSMLDAVDADLEQLHSLHPALALNPSSAASPYFSRKYPNSSSLNGKVSMPLSSLDNKKFNLWCRHYAALTAFYGIKPSIAHLQDEASIQERFAFSQDEKKADFNPERFQANVWTSALSLHITGRYALGTAFKSLAEKLALKPSTASVTRLYVVTSTHAINFEIELKAAGNYVVRFYDPNETSTYKRVVCENIDALERLQIDDFVVDVSNLNNYFESFHSSTILLMEVDTKSHVFREKAFEQKDIPIVLHTLPDPMDFRYIFSTTNVSGLKTVQAALEKAITDNKLTTAAALQILLRGGFIELTQLLSAVYFTHFHPQLQLLKQRGKINQLSDDFPPVPSLAHCQEFLHAYSQTLKAFDADRDMLELVSSAANYSGELNRQVRIRVNDDDNLQLVKL